MRGLRAIPWWLRAAAAAVVLALAADAAWQLWNLDPYSLPSR